MGYPASRTSCNAYIMKKLSFESCQALEEKVWGRYFSFRQKLAEADTPFLMKRQELSMNLEDSWASGSLSICCSSSAGKTESISRRYAKLSDRPYRDGPRPVPTGISISMALNWKNSTAQPPSSKPHVIRLGNCPCHVLMMSFTL